MMKGILQCAVTIATVFAICQTAKILVIFPFNSYSHYILGFRLAKELADRGHQVTFINPFPQKDQIRNMREISVAKVMDGVDGRNTELFEMGKWSFVSQLFFVSKFAELATERALKIEEVQQLLQSNETFDLVLSENFINEAMMIFQYKFKCPSILLVPGPTNVLNNYLFANPSQPAYVPNIHTTFGSGITFWKRLKNLYYEITGKIFIHYILLPRQNDILKRTVVGAPDLKDILYNANFLFTISHVSLNPPFPHNQNIIEIGGHHVLPPKPLPKDLKDFLDNAKEGVVMFSMGGNLKSSVFSKEKREAILNVFSRLKQKVLWKFETDLPGKPKNVKIISWLPQGDVLAHPNIVAFITHTGLLGKIEAVYHGVPLLGLPVFWDQAKNIDDAVRQGFGVSVPFHSLTEENFGWALNELLNNPMYRENAKMQSRIMKDQPMKPMEKAIFWIEYTIRHKGAPHYKSEAVKLRWYQISMLDVICLIFLSICLLFLVILLIFKYVLNIGSKYFTRKNKME